MLAYHSALFTGNEPADEALTEPDLQSFWRVIFELSRLARLTR